MDNFDKTPQMVTELRKKYNQTSTCRQEEIEKIIEIMDAFGIPFFIAKGDGEKLCSMLCREGKVEAVFSTDSDLIALGTPIILNEFPKTQYKNGKKIETFSAIVFEPLLSSLQLSYDTFVDLCIMSGCDYNENIPRLGVGKAYKLLVTHHTIENLPDKYPTDILNYHVCRSLFKYEKFSNLITSTNNPDFDLQIHFIVDQARDRLTACDCDDLLGKYLSLLKNFTCPGKFKISSTTKT